MKTHDEIYIGGAWIPSQSTRRIDVINAATEAVMARVPDGVAADGTVYGLAGAVWSNDGGHARRVARRVARRLRAGRVEINGGAFNMMAPFGGYKQSGKGRELGRYGLEEFLEIKSLQLPQ